MKLTLAILFITILMVSCTACGTTGLSAGRGFTAHLNKCEVLKEQRARGAQQLVAADAAAAEAPTAALIAQQVVLLENRSQNNFHNDNDPRASSPAAAPSSPLPPYPSGRPQRRRQLPKRFRDEPPALPSIVEPPQIPDAPAVALLNVPKVPSSSPSTPTWYPFLNSTVARLMCWFHLGSNLKSIAEFDSLVDDVLLKEDFTQEHLRDFKAARENKRMDDANGENSQDGWQTASVKIKLPAHNVCVPEATAAEFEVEGLLYRPLLDVMKGSISKPSL
ncbi:hypothetical protein MVEN_00302300 [Mycena venus]|uniref:Uncharacterized protein n=1 Tax=Mycena venus TaxID=2733690 RepID=A0A8H6YZ35_9AGAR|nr:hypothetical protein MVEN_00302300 [Mycena venus]